MSMLPIVSNDLRNARLVVCAVCPERKDPPLMVPYCGKCGCTLASKSWFAGTDCPLGKWPKPEAQPVG